MKADQYDHMLPEIYTNISDALRMAKAWKVLTSGLGHQAEQYVDDAIDSLEEALLKTANMTVA
jgi:hypothetical protein